MSQLPQEFVNWLYGERAQTIHKILAGESVSKAEFYLSFTRHNPAVITYGPGGLNGSIKGVGFIPKEEFLQEILDAYMEHINAGWRKGYARKGLELLARLLYSDEGRERLDFTRLGSLELAKSHTWANVLNEPRATLLFFEPPTTSYEVRCRVEIYESGPYHLLLNAQHDVYHEPHPERWPERPAYVFVIEEIYDNSASPQGFGRKIYPV